jgi:hypothetical protein
MDQNALQQIVDRLKEANNVLVTVSANPSVDQLAACIGFTLLLNHVGKHGTAVFSGTVPSTIEFLKPDDTLEKNTDSLRDFIIALDKSKADKLRYKVEDKVVKIFITPYRTSISDKDLEFSQGDFNVDVVMALGVHERVDLDKAIMDHGRILHDATVISVNNKDQGNLGAINWINLNASSLSEMLVELAQNLTKDPLDAQMATAFMTGIVAETDRFSNTKTSPRTMALASQLMSAGANQQLIASKLEAGQPIPAAEESKKEVPKENTESDTADGSLHIAHSDIPLEKEEVSEAAPIPTPSVEDITANDKPTESQPPQLPQSSHESPSAGMPSRPSMALEPPLLGGQLTANSEPEHQDNSTDPLSNTNTIPSLTNTNANPPILSRPASMSGTPVHPASPMNTLTDLEDSVNSPHVTLNAMTPPPADDEPLYKIDKGEELEEAREAVDKAIAAEPPQHVLDPIESLGAQPMDLGLREGAATLPEPPVPTPPQPPVPTPPVSTPPAAPSPFTPSVAPAPPSPAPFGAPPDMNGVNPNTTTSTPVPPSLLPPSQPTDNTASGVTNPAAPPPVPPPLMPPTNGTNPNSPL